MATRERNLCSAWLSRGIAVAALSIVGWTLADLASAEEAAVCTWGGTELAPTGTFEVTPGIRAQPTGAPIHFTVEGDLAGDHPRCTGNMTLDGYFLPGSSCTAAISEAAVGGVPGVVGDVGVGVTFYIRGELFGPDGSVVGSYDDSVTSNGVEESADRCNSPEGFTGGTHWAVVTLYPTAE
jgi:hypothetical protein